MDIYEYLKLDHKKVSDLFKQFNRSNINARKKQIVEMIAREVLVHAHAEQETFYKVLAAFEESKDKADHGKEEHEAIEAQIRAVLGGEVNAAWVRKVEHLQELIDHHVREEEGSFFRKAKQLLSEEDAYMLKEQMHSLKGVILDRMQKTTIKSSALKTLPAKKAKPKSITRAKAPAALKKTKTTTKKTQSKLGSHPNRVEKSNKLTTKKVISRSKSKPVVGKTSKTKITKTRKTTASKKRSIK